MRKLITLTLIVLMMFIMGCSKQTSETQKPTEEKPVADAKVYKLRITSPLMEGAAQSKGLIAWANELEKRSNGQIKIEQMTWSGSVLKPANILEGLRDRVVDVAFISNVYNPTKTPLSNALQPVFLDDMSNSPAIQTELYNTVPELKEEYAKWGIVPVAWFAGADQVLMSNFTFDTLEQLKGKKVRAIGAAMPLAVQKLGGIPLNISSTDSYAALEKGTIDMVAGFPAYALLSNKMGEVSKQVTDFRYGGWCMWFGIAFNGDAYKELPDNIKKIITDIAPVASEAEAKANVADAMAGFKLAKESGTKLVQLSPEEAARWQKQIDPPSIYEDGIKAAEAAGYKNVRTIMDKAVQLEKDYNTKNPHKTLLEQFLENNK